MSSYMYLKVFNVRHDDNFVSCFLPDVCMNSLKCLSECQGILEIAPSEHLSKTERKKIENYTSYIDSIYVSSILKSDLEKLEQLDIFYTIKPDLGKEAVFIKINDNFNDNLKKIKQYFENFVKEETIEPSEYTPDMFYEVYIEEPKQYNGLVYDEQNFSFALSKYEKQFEELIEKRIKYKQLLTSLDYLKLSPDEKENIDSEVAILDEDITTVNQKIAACNKVLSLFEIAYEYNSETLIYIYED